MSARDSVLRSNVQSAMSTAMESRDNFEVTKGMTIMDYAAIRGHAAVIEYLGWLEKDPASPVAGRVGRAGICTLELAGEAGAKGSNDGTLKRGQGFS